METPSKYEYSGGDQENSNDSEWGLEIVIKSTPKKRRKKMVEVDEKDKEIIENLGKENNIDETLEEKAAKSNLSHATVKSILKHVFTDEHVLALVKKIEGCEDVEGIIPYEPKITRSKAKELQLDSSAGPVIPLPWQAPAPAPEVQALLTDDLQEESSGDEYVPAEEEAQSEDDLSFSLPPTPVARTLCFEGEIFKTPNSVRRRETDDDDDDDAEEKIALRTRSKLSLSQTPLEQIEEAFIPPDVTHDMYDAECKDDDWNEFLKSFKKPLEEVVRNEDEEHDPEYNVLSDEEINTVDKEELRADKAVKVPKRELNELMAELFEYVDIYSKKCENLDELPQTNGIDCTTEMIDNALDTHETHSERFQRVETVDSPEFFVKNLKDAFTNSQTLLLEQQMRQHVQMLTQTFILTFRHPILDEFSTEMKEFLFNLKFLSDGKVGSKFECLNLDGAIEFVRKWEETFDEETAVHFETTMEKSVEMFRNNKHDYHLPFPPAVLRTVSESDVFIYPFLLPKIPFKHPDLLKNDYTPFSYSEFQLIALGLEQFVPHFTNNKEYLTLTKQINIRKLCNVISSVIMPGRKPSQIYRQISEKKREKFLPNPIAYYYLHKRAPVSFHQVHPLDLFKVVPPKERIPEHLPRQWRFYIHPEHKKLGEVREFEGEKLTPRPALIFSEPKKQKSPRVLKKIAPILAKTPVKKSELLRELNRKKIEKRHGKSLETLENKFRNCFRAPLTYLKYFSLRELREDTMLPSMPCLNGSESNSSFLHQENAESELSEIKDNTDEINALMVASTTTTVKCREKKELIPVLDKKKARKKKDFLANIAMLSPPDPSVEKDKREHFAMVYFEKLKETLDEDDFKEFKRVFQSVDLRNSSGNAVDLYRKIEPILASKYPELADEFLLFLNEEQANAVGKLIPFFIINHMEKFLRNLEIYFKDQPAQLRKIYRCLYDLNCSNSSGVALDKIKGMVMPLLRGNPLLVDGFLQIFLEESPTATLLNGAWELIDVNKELGKSDEEVVFESITVPDSEDTNCTCSCHKIDEQQPTKQHCINCGLRFVQGKVYCQTSKGLKPVNISFPFDKDVDHTARLSALNSSSRKKPDLSPNKRLSSPSKDSKETPDDLKPTETQQISTPTSKSPKCKTRKVCKKNTTSSSSSPKKTRKDKTAGMKPGSSKGQTKRLPSPEYFDVPSSEPSGDDESSQDEQREIWTREEDKIILETFQKIFDDEAIQLIAKRLKNRKVEQIIARFERLMSILEAMAKSNMNLRDEEPVGNIPGE